MKFLPQQISIGKVVVSIMLTVCFSAVGQFSGGPKLVAAQSVARINSPIAPPSCKKDNLLSEWMLLSLSIYLQLRLTNQKSLKNVLTINEAKCYNRKIDNVLIPELDIAMQSITFKGLKKD